MSDLVVQQTNDDAAASKRHAVRLGYYEDPFITAVSRGGGGFAGGGDASKPPEISRGYWARVVALRAILISLLRDVGCRCQVVNLGAGSDTTYMCLCTSWPQADWLPCKWVDADLQDNTSRKVLQVTSNRQLLEAIGGDEVDIVHNRHELHADPYHIVPADLRDPAAVVSTLRSSCGLDADLPTIFLAECVLVYLPVESSEKLLAQLANQFTKSALLHYEQVNLSDRFGEVMLSNFRSRGCDLAGSAACASEDAQRQRLLRAGWPAAAVWTMRRVYAALPQPATARVERIEMLDEREGFDQLLEHYCIAYAASSPFPSEPDLANRLASVR
ncbi:hypothetical protein BOX15_Mlig027371g3 [Macrostomum lignano]|uniref:Leucine carboxyl methyltransferase 1 n=1 Tax=Macrostomum lignano TaxID=282301 RepID=A0A267E105_9PLAT|nr:hypothetical protein BOX15_Mlig020359g6 [Macrostomum lignano]PAA55228.1 hypothetical protein BOX15_Mlig020359g3 [Macrostomum lignano]PAA55233.1 hypothetical protein BOX15_Mlig027371g3 [Macrostomum lignano]